MLTTKSHGIRASLPLTSTNTRLVAPTQWNEIRRDVNRITAIRSLPLLTVRAFTTTHKFVSVAPRSKKLQCSIVQQNAELIQSLIQKLSVSRRLFSFDLGFEETLKSAIEAASAHWPTALKFGMLVHYGFRRLRNLETQLPIKSKMANGPKFSTLKLLQLSRGLIDFAERAMIEIHLTWNPRWGPFYRYNSATDCSILLKFGTEFDHVAADRLHTSTSKCQKVKVTA